MVEHMNIEKDMENLSKGRPTTQFNSRVFRNAHRAASGSGARGSSRGSGYYNSGSYRGGHHQSRTNWDDRRQYQEQSSSCGSNSGRGRLFQRRGKFTTNTPIPMQRPYSSQNGLSFSSGRFTTVTAWGQNKIVQEKLGDAFKRQRNIKHSSRMGHSPHEGTHSSPPSREDIILQ